MNPFSRLAVVSRLASRMLLLVASACLVAACGSGDEQPYKADKTPLELLSSVPSTNATGVDPTKAIQLNFGAVVGNGSLVVSLFAGETKVAAELRYQGRTVEVVATLDPETDYRLVIESGKDAAGNALAGTPISIAFRTGDGRVKPSTFADVKPIFAASCALGGCHSSSRPTGKLSLVGDEAYDHIVDVHTDVACDGGVDIRVTPGDPESSCLWLLVNADQMPPQDSRDPVPPLSASQKETLRKWIADGALR